MLLYKHFKILKDPFAPILELQDEIKRLGGEILEFQDVYKATINPQSTNSDVKSRMFNLVVANYGDHIKGDLYKLQKVYYQKCYLIFPTSYLWDITFHRPEESLFEKGDAKVKIIDEYNLLKTLPNPETLVLIEKHAGDVALVFNNKYSNIPHIINNFNPIKTQDNSINKLSMKKPTSTFWLCFSIILVGLLFCGTYYFVNKDTGRYEYDSGLIIDKKTGDAKQINLK